MTVFAIWKHICTSYTELHKNRVIYQSFIIIAESGFLNALYILKFLQLQIIFHYSKMKFFVEFKM